MGVIDVIDVIVKRSSLQRNMIQKDSGRYITPRAPEVRGTRGRWRRYNDHPDVMLFDQVYRLLCSYFHATPSKGSNITSGELLPSLMQTRDSLTLAFVPKNKWLEKLHVIVEKDDNEDTTGTVQDHDDHYYHYYDHDYNVVQSSEEIVAYIVGYITRTKRELVDLKRINRKQPRTLSTSSEEETAEVLANIETSLKTGILLRSKTNLRPKLHIFDEQNAEVKGNLNPKSTSLYAFQMIFLEKLVA
ncbi:hypothetical protein M0804_013787 [Polistes exclamans]|nr:hypothetical protein M0804_013787 [Polistes exclamans]